MFDFCTASGEAADNVTLAGENGAGKTRLLEELYRGTRRVYEVGAPVREQRKVILTLDLRGEGYYDESGEEVTEARLITSSDSDEVKAYERVEFYRGERLMEMVRREGLFNRVERFTMNSAYSTTDINYIPREKITGVTDEQLDSGVVPESQDEARDVTQLLIDIASQDNDEIALRVREKPRNVVPKTMLGSLRMERFTEAFDRMFQGRLQYKTVRNNLEPVFDKGGVEVPLSELSSGEKQVVFRSVYLLRNMKNLVGAPIFIDEPELSMHPKWARKIQGYYHGLFVNRDGVQTSQVFMATHSVDVVAAAVQLESSIVLSVALNCDEVKKFSKDIAGEILPTITTAEVKYFVFGLCAADLHVQLYAYIQNEMVKVQAVRGVDDYLLHYKTPKKKSSFKQGSRLVEYHSLPTYIRNAIDHPDEVRSFTDEELEKSTKFMVELIRRWRAGVLPR